MAAPAKTPAKRKKAIASAQPVETGLIDAARAAEDKPAANERIVTMTEETIKPTAADFGAKATDMMNDMTAKAKAAFEKSGVLSKDVVEFHKANLEAVVEAGKLAAKSMQDAAQHSADIGKKRWEDASAHAKTLAGLKSPTDFMSAQSDFLRTQFDAMVADFSKSTEFYMKLAGEVVQPVQNRYAEAAEQVKSRFAA